jgi:hypothetical protein
MPESGYSLRELSDMVARRYMLFFWILHLRQIVGFAAKIGRERLLI